MKEPKVPKGFFLWTCSMREQWIAQHVKPDLDTHNVCVSFHSDETLHLECSCGWAEDAGDGDHLLTNLNRIVRAHTRNAKKGKKVSKKNGA